MFSPTINYDRSRQLNWRSIYSRYSRHVPTYLLTYSLNQELLLSCLVLLLLHFLFSLLLTYVGTQLYSTPFVPHFIWNLFLGIFLLRTPRALQPTSITLGVIDNNIIIYVDIYKDFRLLQTFDIGRQGKWIPIHKPTLYQTLTTIFLPTLYFCIRFFFATLNDYNETLLPGTFYKGP